MLISVGVPVVALSRRGSGSDGEHARHWRVADYCDPQAMVRALNGCETLVHLAARAHRMRDDPATTEAAFRAANVDASRAVALAAREAGVQRVVLVSSIGVHGSRTAGRAFTEADAPDPGEPYAVSKWHGEEAVTEALADSATSLVILRPTLVYGPGAPGHFAQLLKLVQHLPVVPLGGLHRKRSFIHVDNLCDAIWRASWHSGAAGRRFVLSDGEDLSVAELSRELAVGMGRRPGCIVAFPQTWLHALATLAGRGQAVAKLADELMADASAFREATGWVPPRKAREALRETAAAYIREGGRSG